jgi:uncharacterized membrane protein
LEEFNLKFRRIIKMTEQPMSPEITSDDKLWAAIGYPISPLAVIVLFMEDKKARPFIKYHAVQSIAFNIILYVLISIIAVVTLGFGAICAPLFWLVVIWPAIEAYQGKYLEIPILTNFLKKQKWI